MYAFPHTSLKYSACSQENPQVFFDLQLGRYGDATPLGRVVMELKADIVPKTAENFRKLAESQEVSPRQTASCPSVHFYWRTLDNPVCRAGGQWL